MARGKERKERELTEKQLRFIDHYLLDPTSVAKAATAAGYSPKSSALVGHKLMRNYQVRDEIKRRRRKLENATGITLEKIERELALIAFADITDYVLTTDGRLSVAGDLKNNGRTRAVAKAKVRSGPAGEETEITLHDKIGALKLLGMRRGLAGPGKLSVELSGPGGSPVGVAVKSWTEMVLEADERARTQVDDDVRAQVIDAEDSSHGASDD